MSRIINRPYTGKALSAQPVPPPPIAGSSLAKLALSEGTAGRQGLVSSELECLRTYVDQMEQLVGLLEERLPPILRPDEPSPEGKKVSECLPAPLAETICVEAKRILGLNARINSILSRCEL